MGARRRAAPRPKPTAPAGPGQGQPTRGHRRDGHASGRRWARPGAKELFSQQGTHPTSRGSSGSATEPQRPPLRGPALREPGALQRKRRGPTAGPAPTPMAAPQPGCRALTAEEGAEDEALLLVPLEETPQGPQHPARPARPPLASPCRRKGRGQRPRPPYLAARPPGNTARAPPVPAMEEEAATLHWMDQAFDMVSAGGGQGSGRSRRTSRP